MVLRPKTDNSGGGLSASETAVLRQKLLNKQALIEQQTALIERSDERIERRDELIERRDQRIRQLEELIRSFKQQRFGASSEKLSPDQLGLFNEAEECFEEAALPETQVKPHSRRSRGRPALPADLPREEIIYDLDEADKICPRDGAALKLIGEQTSEQLEIIPATVKVIRHIQLKYACPCCDQHVATAVKPKQPLCKSIAGPGLLAYIVTAKYQDALPLYRQNKIFERLGVNLDRTTLANWMIRCGELTQPLINLMTEGILEHPWVHMDETPVQVLKEPGKTAQSKSYMWVLGAGAPGHRTVVFRYDAGRSGAVPTDMLGDYQGALMVDGYPGYGPVCNARSLARLGCWTHARRKFVEAKRDQPKGKTGRADQALAYIQKLYRVEKQAKDATPEQRKQLRQDQAKPVIEQLKTWLEKTSPRVPPQSKLGLALHYLDNQWPRLIRYLDDGQYPIDNNFLENAIRPFAIGRKNWMFANSQAGARASANLYTMIETAKGHGLEPYHYLRRVFKALPLVESVEDIEALLPQNIKGGDL